MPRPRSVRRSKHLAAVMAAALLAAPGCDRPPVVGSEPAPVTQTQARDARHANGKLPPGSKPPPQHRPKLAQPLRFSSQRLSLAGAATAYANDMNDQGIVVGSRPHPRLGQVAAVWQNGKLVDMGRLNHLRSEAFAVDETGAVVGWCRRPNESPHPFVLRAGVLFEAPLLEGFSEASFFAAAGQVAAGTATRLQDASAAVVWTGESSLSDATLKRVPTHGTASAAHGMNENGQVVGELTDWGGKTFGFIWQQGQPLQRLRGIGDNDTKAYGVNEAGVVVGGAYTSQTEYAAARWDKGELTLLAGLPHAQRQASRRCWAFDINRDGWIAGWSLTPDGQRQVAVVWVDGKPLEVGLSPEQVGIPKPLEVGLSPEQVGIPKPLEVGLSPEQVGIPKPLDLNQCSDSHQLVLAKAVNNHGQVLAMAQDDDGLMCPVVLSPVYDGEKTRSQVRGARAATLNGVWIIDWVRTAERYSGKRRKELMMLSYVCPANRMLRIQTDEDVVSIHCPLLNAPEQEHWQGASVDGKLLLDNGGRIEPLEDGTLLATLEGDSWIYVRDPHENAAIALDEDVVADFIESRPSRLMRLTWSYDWASLSPSASKYLDQCKARLDQHVRELEGGDGDPALLSQLRWRRDWIAKVQGKKQLP